jgi:potassium-transporting ATPase KdpC subunit
MREFRRVLILFAVLAVLVGGLYPAIVTAISKIAFPSQAEGSLVRDAKGDVIGSELIGQPFSAPKYFWPRPSATGDRSYDAMTSGGSQLGPTNPKLADEIAERVAAWRASGVSGPVPSDLVMASGSGLDPDVTPEASLVQVPRVAKARGMSEALLRGIVAEHTEGRSLGFLGGARVNVPLDAMEGEAHGGH